MRTKLQFFNTLLIVSVVSYLYYQDFFTEDHKKFKEVSAERINIIGENGNKYIVLSNPEKQALATLNGKILDTTQIERLVPGLLFFNQDGDEIGGLIYSINETNNFQMLTFDQRKNDQIMTLRNDETFSEGEWKRRSGLQFSERSHKQNRSEFINEYNFIKKIEDKIERRRKLKELFDKPENKQVFRMHVGRFFNGKTGLFLFDDEGNTRISIYLDKDGNPKIEQVTNEDLKKK